MGAESDESGPGALELRRQVRYASCGMQALAESSPPPAGIRLVKAGQPELVVEWRWFRARDLFVLFCCAGLLVFFVFWYSLLPAPLPLPAKVWPLYVGPVVFISIIAWGMYTSMAGVVNKTTLRIANGWLSVHHAPVPWRGTWKLPSNRIRQFHLQSREPGGGRATPLTYEVHVGGDGLGWIKLLAGLHSLEQAEFIAVVVQNHLRHTPR